MRNERTWLVRVLFHVYVMGYYMVLDILGESAKMTVLADLAQLVEQRTRNA